MKIWNRLKQKWKKNMRKRKNAFAIEKWLGAGLLLVVFMFMRQPINIYAAVDDISAWFADEPTKRAVLHRVYICGDEIEDLGQLKYDDVTIMMLQNPHWDITTDEEKTLIRFVEEVNDLSSYCKEHAYFGISGEGNLSLFDGIPAEEKVMKTFFQLNLPYMESKLPDEELAQLTTGIRARDIDEYESILSTYSEFSIDRREPVNRPYY